MREGVFLTMIELKPCPFCGADAQINWTLGKFGKAIKVSCSRDGECPSPEWIEDCTDHEDDAACLDSVTRFWNTRAEDWESETMNRLRVRLAKAEQELIVVRCERDRAMKACEEIAAAYQEPPR